MEPTTTATRDFVNDRLMSFLLWYGPAIAMVATALVSLAAPVRGLIWAACLGTLGAGCVANALRCGRVHCYITGPFFLTMAVSSLLYGLDLVPFGKSGWAWIGGVTVVGAGTLTFVPEWIWGRYARGENE
jgi:hypothetical protein